jgi:radical SAM protein with 4Fe4S-binding SPASM domain
MEGLWLDGEERKACAQRLADLHSMHNGFVNATLLQWYGLLSSPPIFRSEPSPIHRCSAGTESCALRADGSVLACNAAPDYVCGSIRDQDLANIWLHSPEMQAVRTLSRLTAEDVVGCQECAYRFSCTTGCRADAWAITESWTGGPAPTCWHRLTGL